MRKSIILTACAAALLTVAGCNRPAEEAAPAADEAMDAAAADAGSMGSDAAATAGSSGGSGASGSMSGSQGADGASAPEPQTMATGAAANVPPDNPQVPGGVVNSSDPVPPRNGGYASHGPG